MTIASHILGGAVESNWPWLSGKYLGLGFGLGLGSGLGSLLALVDSTFVITSISFFLL